MELRLDEIEVSGPIKLDFQGLESPVRVQGIGDKSYIGIGTREDILWAVALTKIHSVVLLQAGLEYWAKSDGKTLLYINEEINW